MAWASERRWRRRRVHSGSGEPLRELFGGGEVLTVGSELMKYMLRGGTEETKYNEG